MLLGVLAQYVIMPLIALALVKILNLPEAVAVGIILVGSAPGGTSSNVISYLAKADVALSVTMTAVSTLLAPIMTPLLVQWMAGTIMDIDGGAMAISIVKTVVVPVLGGLLLRLILPRVIDKILPVLPWVSTFGICAVVIGVVPGSSQAFATAGAVIFAAVIFSVWHNLSGAFLSMFYRRTAEHTATEPAGEPAGAEPAHSGLARPQMLHYFARCGTK